ncbi:hypothetical protein E0L93_14615 [Rubrobacter taiwanensis]|uniref:Uncharacterized protein n=1 Tax=Rubrobacter taiwanensis TaxID=185139 RepID=A0A4R1B9R7_9ACTN|nr:hypothetical protein [Rubrobacter taiwanensis]TCJ13647.1 hypothetical protein E0L93_14615 [Rubrobacter taiwanensis]
MRGLSYKDRRELYGLAILAGVLALVGLAAKTGSARAGEVFQYGVGFLGGYALVFLLTLSKRWGRRVAALLALIFLAYLASRPSLEVSGASLAAGTGFGFSIAVVRRLFPSPFEPRSPEEARRRGREALRNWLVVGSLWLGLAVLVLTLFGVLVLFVYAVGTFAERGW